MFQTIFIQPLFNLLTAIYAILPGHDFGVAVIILTVLIRLILWPLVNRQLHSQRALQKLQPEVIKIRAKTKGDRQEESRLLMELYKERNVSPFGSLLPLIIQLPVFLALYSVLRDIVKPGEIAHLGYSSVKHLGPIAHILAHGGSLDPRLFNLINLSKPAAILAVTAGLAQFLQTKQLTPKASKGDSQAQAMQTMVYIFPVITLLIGLTLPAALALYWTVSSLVACFQQWLILRKDVAELEEGVIVTQPKPAGGKKQASR